jgi:hypothetical protein
LGGSSFLHGLEALLLFGGEAVMNFQYNRVGLRPESHKTRYPPIDIDLLGLSA